MDRVIFLIKLAGLFLIMLASQLVNAATFNVTSNADAGANTLRQAIINANGAAGADIINFNFAAATTITLSTCLPQITGQTTINGYSNIGSGAGNLMIEVISPTGCNGFDFAVGSDGSMIQGLVISGGTTGVYLRNSNNHIVKGNYIGTNMAGTAMAASRLQDGIHLNSSANSTIGGTGGQVERNIISGAVQDGIRMEISTNATIINNYIGVDASGNVALANSQHGIETYNNSHNMRVGGTTLSERNVISANLRNGVYSNASRSPVVKGNMIGIGADGTTKLGNAQSGIDLENTGIGPAQVGGTTFAERNYSSCNGAFGVVLRSANNSVIEGNWLGVDAATGLLDYGNNDAAITVTASADVRVGGSVSGSGNICSASGNPGGGADGISIWSNSPRPVIKGNIIGLGADGITPLQNYGHGIECLTCDDGVIGGPTLLERNLIACSFLIGMQLVNSPRMVIINNYLGTDISGTLDRGGAQMGINISSSSDLMIGGSLANANIIAYNNASAGIVVSGDSQRNTITFNSIFCNSGPGIDLTGAGNESVLTPSVTTSGSNSVNGTGTDGDVIHAYRNSTNDGSGKCNCEGEIYLGTTTVSGGLWSIAHNLGLSAADAATVTATQTTPLGSTSEFSTCSAPPLPVELVSFDIVRTAEDILSIKWSTAMEQNNSHFNVQRSTDGVNFETIAVVQGRFNSNVTRYYSSIDDHLPDARVIYYRLVQVDKDGAWAASRIKSISAVEEPLYILQEPDGFTLSFWGSDEEPLYYEVYSVTGVLVLKGFIPSASVTSVHIALPAVHSVYIVHASTGKYFVQKKILITE